MVMPSEVLVISSLDKDLVEAALVPIALVDHVFPIVVIAILPWDMGCLVFFLTLFLLGK